jgi:hypothetical protein
VLEFPQPGRVQLFFAGGVQDGQAPKHLQPLSQPGSFQVRITVVTVLHLGPPAKECISPIEEQERSTILRSVEYPAEVFFGLANVLVHHRRQIDAIQVEPQFARQHSSCQRLARSVWSGK